MATKSKSLTPEQIKAIKDATERKKAVNKWVEEQMSLKRQAAERKRVAEEKRARVDSGPPKKASEPAGRVVQPGWKKRKPIFKGGVVTGTKKGNNFA